MLNFTLVQEAVHMHTMNLLKNWLKNYLPWKNAFLPQKLMLQMLKMTLHLFVNALSTVWPQYSISLFWFLTSLT